MLGLGEGLAIIGLGVQLWDKYKDGQAWETADKEVDAKWLDVAKERGVVDADAEYVWSRARSVETRRLKGTMTSFMRSSRRKRQNIGLSEGSLS